MIFNEKLIHNLFILVWLVSPRIALYSLTYNTVMGYPIRISVLLNKIFHTIGFPLTKSFIDRHQFHALCSPPPYKYTLGMNQLVEILFPRAVPLKCILPQSMHHRKAVIPLDEMIYHLETGYLTPGQGEFGRVWKSLKLFIFPSDLHVYQGTVHVRMHCTPPRKKCFI